MKESNRDYNIFRKHDISEYSSEDESKKDGFVSIK